MNEIVAALTLLLSLEQSGSKQVLHLEPPAQHHLNIEAPNSVKDKTGKISKKLDATDSKLRFELSPALNAPFTVTAYLCDNAKTYCVKKTHQIDTLSSLPPAQHTPPQKNGVRKQGSSPLSANEDFLKNDPKTAFATAKKHNRPILIDFFGIWCPPCNLLDAEVFAHPDFKKTYASFVKLKMDADSPLSWELKSKYKVTGYPTIIFADTSGTELGRMIGYYPLSDFLTVHTAISSGMPFPQIQAELSLPHDALMSKAEEAEKNGNIDSARNLWLAASALLKKTLNERSKLKHVDAKSLERSISTDLAYSLYRGGKVKEAESLYRKMQRLYPQEFTFSYYYARMLNDLGRSKDAEAPARLAVKYSYGDNHLRSVDALAVALHKQGKSEEANNLIEATIKATTLPEDSALRTHRYLNKLRETQASFAKASTQ